MSSYTPSWRYAMSGRAVSGARLGAGVGGVLLLIGLIRLVGAGQGLPGDLLRSAIGLGVVYVTGFALAGAAVGALWPLRKTWRGAIVVGYAGAAIVSTVVMAIIASFKDASWHEAAITVAIMTLIFGTVAAVQFRSVR